MLSVPRCLFAGGLLLLGACGGEDSSGSSDKPPARAQDPSANESGTTPSTPSQDPGATKSGTEASKQAEPPKPAELPKQAEPPKQAELPLVVTDEVVRLAGARAILQLPELPSSWTIVHKHNSRLSGLQLFRGTPEDFSGFVTLVFAPSASGRTPESYYAEVSKSLAPGLAPMVAAGPAAATEIPGGLATSWSGTNQYGVDERAYLAVVVQDDQAINLLVRSQAGLFDSELLPMAKQLLAGLRLGSKVPRLGDKSPSERISGVWEHLQGLSTDWLIFDPRGYAHFGSPSDPAVLDFDICYALGQQLYKYQIANGQIVLERVPPDPDYTRRWSFSHKDDALVIEDEEYRRVDTLKFVLAPGTYEAYTAYDTGNAYTGSTGIAVDEHQYVFAADGTYTYTGGFSYMHTEMDGANPGTIDWTSSGYAAPEPGKGNWKVDGNTLVLDDGKVVAKRTLFPTLHTPGKVIYINGRMFVHKKP